MNSLIVIRGPAGCGKTTVARELATLRKASVVHLDKELAADGLDNIINGAIPLENFRKTMSRLNQRIEKTLKEGKDIIIDGCFYYQELISDLEIFSPHIFTLEAPIQVCISRDASRPQSLGARAVEEVWKLVAAVSAGTSIDVADDIPEDAVRKINVQLASS